MSKKVKAARILENALEDATRSDQYQRYGEGYTDLRSVVNDVIDLLRGNRK